MKHLATLTIFVIFITSCGDSKLRMEAEDVVSPFQDTSADSQQCEPGEELVDGVCVVAEVQETDASEETDDSGELCGNGSVEGTEDCDGDDLNSESCESLGFESGDLACANCFFNATSCQGLPENCGNDALDPEEDCDGAKLGYATCETLGFEGGTLSCTNCFFDTSGCQNLLRNCGNSAIDAGEDCDSDLMGYATCEALGFEGGTLTCGSDCKFDTSQCTEVPPELCGNGAIDVGEDCEGDNIGYATCEALGFESGTLTCGDDCKFDTSQCVEAPPELCGNDSINVGEDCDGSNLGYATCEALGFEGGTLSCRDDCQFDTSQCTGTPPELCGNGTIDAGENCDGDELDNVTCADLGFDNGVLACSEDCEFEYSGCTSTPAGCGDDACDAGESYVSCPEDCTDAVCNHDGIIDPGEDCDDENMNNKSCEDFADYSGGTLFCYWEDCTFSFEGCVTTPETCGNDQLDDGEDCDGDLLGGSSCESLGWGYTGGDLACDSCAFDDSGCTPQCGDGLCEAGESFATCPEDCEDVCVDNPMFSFGDGNPTELEQNIVAHVGQISLEGGDQEVTLETITLRVVAQVAAPDTGSETWRLRSETTLILADYDADVTGDENGLVVFSLNSPMTIAPTEVRVLDIQVNTAEMDTSGDNMQLFIQTDCDEIEGPTLVLP